MNEALTQVQSHTEGDFHHMETAKAEEHKFIQIRKVREYIKQNSTDTGKIEIPLEPDQVFTSHEHLYREFAQVLAKIPETERYNLFGTLGYTAGETPEKRVSRSWVGQDVMFFDIDDIAVLQNGSIAEEKYLEAVGAALKLDPHSFSTFFTGHGLHILVGMKTPIESAAYFKKNKFHYQVVCGKINDELAKRGLKGKADTQVFAPNYMFRLPGSLNKKPNEPVRTVRELNLSFERHDFDLKKISGLPDIDDKAQISKKELSYFKLDHATIQDGCNFIKWTKENASKVDEPQWYAMISIVARLPGGRELVHEYSRKHPSYSEEHTNQKIDQALKMSGPRTCENIESMYPGCSECKYYKKVRSPIQIKGPKFIATEDSGFHTMDRKGQLVPQFKDLMLHYDAEAPFISIEETGENYRWSGTDWQLKPELWLENYAQEKFNPFVKSHVTREFMNTIRRNNLRPHKWFTTSTSRKINLSNGILDIDSLKLSPHSPELGFRHTLPFNYDPSAQAPLFTKMLNDVTCGDLSMQMVLLEYMGYILSGDKCFADKMLVLTGEGQNGKSRFVQIMQALIGEKLAKFSFSQIKSDFMKIMLDGAFMCLFEEIPKDGERESWEILKDWSAGGIISACKKHKDFIFFENKAKIVITCNRLPFGTDPSHGWFRRLLILPFEATFSYEAGNIDTDIANKIIASELPGVLNLVLEAYARLKKQNYQFTQSKASDTALAEYKSFGDSALRWFEDNLCIGSIPKDVDASTPGIGRFIGISSTGSRGLKWNELFKAYNEQVIADGEKAVSKKEFTLRFMRWLKGVQPTVKSLEKGFQRNFRCGAVEYSRCRVAGNKEFLLFGCTTLEDSGHNDEV